LIEVPLERVEALREYVLAADLPSIFHDYDMKNEVQVMP
jgi:hypothetical protein